MEVTRPSAYGVALLERGEGGAGPVWGSPSGRVEAEWLSSAGSGIVHTPLPSSTSQPWVPKAVVK